MTPFRIFLLILTAFPLMCYGEVIFHAYPYYISAPIDARVVDEETNQPIEGAHVTANWQMVTGGWDGPRYKNQLELMETVTDKDGHFHFDGFTKANPHLYELRTEDPKIIMFKSGYEYRKIVNVYPRDNLDKPGTTEGPNNHLRSWIDGKTVKLKKLKGTPIGLRTSFYSGLSTEVRDPYLEDCGWKKVPKMILAMHEEKHRLLSLNPEALVDLIDFYDVNQSGCGSATEFFKESPVATVPVGRPFSAAPPLAAGEDHVGTGQTNR